MATPAKVIAGCLLLALSMQMCCGSAIPIWEFLTRNEKMSHLYSTFAQLVSVHCKATAATTNVPVNQCKRNLLTYGYEKLQTFSDAQLDAFDPYQRGGNELIWSSIMRDHPSSTLVTTRNPLPTPPATSIIILTHQKPIKPSTPSAPVPANTAAPHHEYPQNPLFGSDAEPKHKYAMDMDIAYGYPGMPHNNNPQVEIFEPSIQQQQLSHKPNTATTTQGQPKTYLTGPLVFRVRPDGTPVEEDQYRPLPRDDDLEVFHVTPTVSKNNNNNNASPSGRPNKHRKIATISALKEQRLATLALHQQLLPPLETPRVRRQFHVGATSGYHYGRGQA